MNIDNDELAKDVFVLSKDHNYKNSKKLISKYQFLIISYYFFQNDTWTGIHDRHTSNKYHITGRSIPCNERNNLE